MGAGAGAGRGRDLGAGDRAAAGDESADGGAVGAERRAAAVSAGAVGSKLDPFEAVLRRLLAEWPQIKAPRVTELLRDEYGYDGSVDLVKRRLRALRPRMVRPAQRTGHRPGQVL